MRSPVTDEELLWDHAMPLARATLAYAPPRLKEKWQALANASAIETIKTSLQKEKARDPSQTRSFFDAIQPGLEVSAARSAALRDCERALQDYLTAGALRSFAFESPRTLASPAIELPARLWPAQHSMDISKVMFEGITYVEIRVIGPKQAAAVLRSNAGGAGAQAKVGRPSYKADIESAFEALVASGLFNLEHPVKSQTGIIRDWLHNNRPEGGYSADKPGYDLIRKTLNPLIKSKHAPQADKL